MKRVLLFLVWAAMGLTIAGCAGIHYIPRETREWTKQSQAQHQAWEDSVDARWQRSSDSLKAVWELEKLAPEMEIDIEGLSIQILEYHYMPGATITISPLYKADPSGIMHVAIYWTALSRTNGLYKMLVLKGGEVVFQERSRQSNLLSINQSVSGDINMRWSNIISAPLKPTDEGYEVVLIEGVDDEVLRFTISPSHKPKPLTEI